MPLTCRRIGHRILQKTPPTFVFCSKQFPQIITLDTAMEEPDGGVETTSCAAAPSVSTAQKAPKADAPVGGAVPASSAGAQSALTEEKLQKGRRTGMRCSDSELCGLSFSPGRAKAADGTVARA